MFTSKFKVAFALLLMVGMAAVHAGGGGSVMGNGGATEITQVLNNGQLIEQVRQQVNTVNQLMQTYRVQYSQLQQQILSGTNLGNTTLGDVNRARSTVDAYQGSLKTVGFDLANLQQTYDRRLVEARLQNMTMEQYLARERQKIADGNAVAQARLAREKMLIEQTNQDMAIAKQYGEDAANTVGEHEAIALLNRQMNLQIQQNTRMMTAIASSQNSDRAMAEMRDEVDRQEVTQKVDDAIAAQKRMKEAELRMIRGNR